MTPNYQLVYLFAFLGGYALLIAFCEILNRRMHVDSEYTRKIAHIVSTLSVLFYPYIFKDAVYALILCAACCLVLLVANRMRILHSIDGVGRRTGGSYLLALSVGICYFISVKQENTTLYTIPILILAISDPLAGITGKRIVSKSIFNGKTVAGSLAFLVSALLISLIHLAVTHHVCIWGVSIIIALTATLTELLSPRGTDNLTIPLSVIAVLSWM